MSSTLSTYCVYEKSYQRWAGEGGGWIIFKKLCTQFFHNCQFIWSFPHTHTSSFSFPRHIKKIQISDANFFFAAVAVAAMMMFIIKVFSPFVRHKLKLMWYGLNWDAIKAAFFTHVFYLLPDLTLQTTKKISLEKVFSNEKMRGKYHYENIILAVCNNVACYERD